MEDVSCVPFYPLLLPRTNGDTHISFTVNCLLICTCTQRERERAAASTATWRRCQRSAASRRREESEEGPLVSSLIFKSSLCGPNRYIVSSWKIGPSSEVKHCLHSFIPVCMRKKRKVYESFGATAGGGKSVALCRENIYMTEVPSVESVSRMSLEPP